MGDQQRSWILPIGLFFVSVFAAVRALMEFQNGPPHHFLVKFLGPAPMLLLLVGMIAIGVVWFARGRVDWPLRKVLALALVSLPFAAMLGTLQAAEDGFFWGGVAGENVAIALLGMLPDVLAAGVSGLLVIFSLVLASRLAFLPPEETPKSTAGALALAMAGGGTVPLPRMERQGHLATVIAASDGTRVISEVAVIDAPEPKMAEEAAAIEPSSEAEAQVEEEIDQEEAPEHPNHWEREESKRRDLARRRRILEDVVPMDAEVIVAPEPLLALHRELEEEGEALEERFAALEAEEARSRLASRAHGSRPASDEQSTSETFGHGIWDDAGEVDDEMEETAVLETEERATPFHLRTNAPAGEDEDDADLESLGAPDGEEIGFDDGDEGDDAEEEEGDEEFAEAEGEEEDELDEEELLEDEETESLEAREAAELVEVLAEDDLDAELEPPPTEPSQRDSVAETSALGPVSAQDAVIGFKRPDAAAEEAAWAGAVASGQASSSVDSSTGEPPQSISASGASTADSQARAGESSKAKRPARDVASRIESSPHPIDETQYARAVDLVGGEVSCSTAMLQRRLSISYSQANAILEQMHHEGIVGRPLPSGRREILEPRGVREFSDTAEP